MSQDVPAESLPDGPLPIWIEIPTTRITQLEILRQVATLEEIQGSSVTVMYNMDPNVDEQTNMDGDADASAFCQRMNWRYVDSQSMCGLEDEAVIVLDPVPPICDQIFPEYISRATSKLIMTTTVDNKKE